MTLLLPATIRILIRFAACTLAFTVGASAVALATPAHAATTVNGPTGLHDRMLPADSPDARTTTAATADTQTASVASPVGVDVASWQHPSGAPIDWTKVAASGQSFAIVKATELYTDSNGQPALYTNPYFHSDMTGAHAAGLVVGTYAFAHPENSATAQADAFASTIGTLPSPSLPPVLDLETTGGLGVAALVSWTHTFLNRLQADTGIQPMIYAGPNFWKTYLGNSTEFASYPLWEAHYTTAAAPASMGGWSTYTMWQYTSTASVPGITGNVDQSRFNTATGATPGNLHAPIGYTDAVQVAGAGTLTVKGWSIDPDAPTAAVNVHVYVDGAGHTVTADADRPDVASVYPAAGAEHGFVFTTQVDPGTHTVCVYAIDTSGNGPNTAFGCRTARFAGSWFYLNDQFTGQANIVMSFGDPTDQILVGNTNGTGGDKLIARRGNHYYVRNSLTTGGADFSFTYGDAGDTVLIGDWNGDGTDTLAVRRGNHYYIKNSLTTGVADKVVAYGDAGDTIMVGDWNGDGTDTLAVRRGNHYYLKNSISSGVADSVITYGNADDTVLAGRWNGHTTGLAVRRGITYYLKYTLTTGTADVVFAYGNPGDTVLVGDWNGDGTDSLGVRRIG